SRGRQMKLDREGPNWRRVLKVAIHAVLSLLLGNLFLAYFVGVDRRRVWLVASTLEQPGPFIIVMFTAALVFFDFAYFRAQMCTILCPYARLHSGRVDSESLLVGYDAGRVEPRGMGRNTAGVWIDCQASVFTCPTGIAIRNGLQLECVKGTQCVDA